MAGKRRRLAARRRALGFTQESLAERLGVHPTTVRRWENGGIGSGPHPWVRRKLAEHLQVSAEELEELLTEGHSLPAADVMEPPGHDDGALSPATGQLEHARRGLHEVVAGAALGFAVVTLLLAHAVGPRKKTKVKEMTYESGMDPIGSARQKVDVKFYLIAILFLVFDVELLFLYPWAVSVYRDTPVLPVELRGPAVPAGPDRPPKRTRWMRPRPGSRICDGRTGGPRRQARMHSAG